MSIFNYTYQDFLDESDKIKFLKQSIAQYRACDDYKFAIDANEYYKQRNTAILKNVKQLYTMTGSTVPDFTASNIQLCSNFLHRLIVQRLTYSLGNGVSFANDRTTNQTQDGEAPQDTTKNRLGQEFDTFVFQTAKNALIHGVAYGFWNRDKGHVFPMTEFMPLFDEYDGTLKAGARFWSIDWDRKPVTVVLYEEDGYTTYRTKSGYTGLEIEEIEPKRAYVQIIQHSEIDGDSVISESNYSSLPIVPLYGNSMHTAVLLGIKSMIDAFDLINSGLANDVNDCAQIYWMIGNASGMQDKDLIKFRDQLKFMHIAVVDTDNSSVTPYTQEVPVASQQTALAELRAQIYESFGALDVHTVSAGATNDHIDAAYQPMDEEADDFEYQIIVFIKQILKLISIDDTPEFKRNRISNQMEQVQMVMLEAQYLDDETLLQKLPNIYSEEIPEIMSRKQIDAANRFALENSAGEMQNTGDEV